MKMMDFRDNLQKCQEYINALEEERKKIHVFQRELPLCLELVTGAIEACKQQLSGTTVTTECLNGHSECSEQTTSNGPVYEEFIPLKRNNYTDDDEEDELESNKPQINNNLIDSIDKSGQKSDWLRSVQLWNQTPDPPTTQQENHQPKKVAVVEVKRNGNGGAFHPFQKEKSISENGNNKDHHPHNNNNHDNIINNNNNNNKQSTSTAVASASSSAHEEEMGPSSGGSKKEEKGGQSQRKARRCWSPELHRRFVHALQQLGGSHVATPKQIRDLMKVDGLTNDEVKSHLQKYRLHTRRPNSGAHNNANTQAPQFVVVGGIWMPPADYTAPDTSTPGAAPSSIYAPIAAVAAPPTHQTSAMVTHKQQQPNQSNQSHCEERASHSEGRVRSNSPATSSSTHTTTASHAH